MVRPSRSKGLFKRWWPFWLLFFSAAIPFSLQILDPPAKVAELSGVVNSIQRLPGRSMAPGASLSKMWVKAENGVVVGFDVDPDRYRAGEPIRIVQYQRKLTGLISWEIAR